MRIKLSLYSIRSGFTFAFRITDYMQCGCVPLAIIIIIIIVIEFCSWQQLENWLHGKYWKGSTEPFVLHESECCMDSRYWPITYIRINITWVALWLECVFMSIVIVSWNEVLPVNNTRKRNIVTLNAYNYNYNAHGYNWLGRCQINCRAAELEGRLNRLAWFECQIIYRAMLEFSPLPTHSYDYIQQTENLEWTMSMST